MEVSKINKTIRESHLAAAQICGHFFAAGGFFLGQSPKHVCGISPTLKPPPGAESELIAGFRVGLGFAEYFYRVNIPPAVS